MKTNTPPVAHSVGPSTTATAVTTSAEMGVAWPGPTSPATECMTALTGVTSTSVCVRAGSVGVATVYSITRGVMGSLSAVTDQMRRGVPTSVMPPSSDVTETETVLTSAKYVTRILTVGTAVMNSTARTPAVFAGRKGN